MDVTATEFKNRLGRYLDASESRPVIIKKSGRIKSVLISHQLYEKFLALEDFRGRESQKWSAMRWRQQC